MVGSAATKIKQKQKEAQGIAEGRGGARGPENVWGSAATAAMCALYGFRKPSLERAPRRGLRIIVSDEALRYSSVRSRQGLRQDLLFVHHSETRAPRNGGAVSRKVL